MTDAELIAMARLAQRDERMSTGALYGDLADRIEELVKERKAMAMRDAGYDVYAGLEAKLAKTKLLLAKAIEALKTIKLIDTHEVLDFDTCEPIDTRQGIPAQIAEETLTEIEKELPTS